MSDVAGFAPHQKIRMLEEFSIRSFPSGFLFQTMFCNVVDEAGVLQSYEHSLLLQF